MRSGSATNSSVFASRFCASKAQSIRLSTTCGGLRHFTDSSVAEGTFGRISASVWSVSMECFCLTSLLIQTLKRLLKISTLPVRAATFVQEYRRRIT